LWCPTVSVMDPCTGEGQNNFLSTIPKTERHATAETLSASSYKGHGHYCKEPLTRAWQSMERYGPPLAMQHGHHLHKWNFTSFEIMAEISTLSLFPIYLDLQRWARVIVWEYFMRTGQSCLVSYNILYFFLRMLDPVCQKKVLIREWFCLALCLVLECWHCHFVVCWLSEY